VAEEDRLRWDARHLAGGGSSGEADPGIPAVFAPYGDLFPRVGFALDLACGRGAASVWLARLGLEVLGVDISRVALDRARGLAARFGVSGRCRFQLADLDLGLPSSPPAEVVLCHMFRDRRLYGPIMERLKGGGLLAMAVLSEVDAEPGPFRAGPGELKSAFADLSVIADGEGDGRAWLLARKRPVVSMVADGFTAGEVTPPIDAPSPSSHGFGTGGGAPTGSG
jgi:SAM-dependent methyltransferase